MNTFSPLASLALTVKLILLFAAYCLIFISCAEDESIPGNSSIDPLAPAATITTTLYGLVQDEEGMPLQGVTITVHGETTTTSAEGTFRLEQIEVPGNRCVIRSEKTGYFTGVRAEIPLKNRETSVRIRMINSATTHTINALEGGTAELANGSKVQIPAAGVVTETGSVYEGTVKMSVRYLDPSAISFGAFVAGGDMLARRTDESTSILYSYGILKVVLSGSTGEKLQLAPGKPSTLTVAVPASQLATAPPSIPLWYFDEEEGVWVEEGTATLQGDKYTGTVAHFTDWNCDEPSGYATIIGKVVDCDGGTVLYGDVYVGQSTSNLEHVVPISNDGSGEGSSGKFSIRVPVGIPLMVVVPPPVTPISLVITETAKWVLVPVPPLSKGQVYDAGEIRPHPCPSIAKGSFKLKQGDKVKAMSMKVIDAGSNQQLNTGIMPVPNVTTTFSANFLAANATYALQVVTESGLVVDQTFQTKAAGETVNLGVIDLTGAQLIPVEGVVLCYNTPIEDAAVTVEWQGGSVNTTTDNLGLYALMMPVNTAATVTVNHARGTGTKNFQTPAGDGYRVEAVAICDSHATTGENSFMIHGDGYTHVQKTISLADYPESYAYFDRDNSITQVEAADVSGEVAVSLTFPGNTVGSGAIGGRITLQSGSQTVDYLAGYGTSGTSLTITVSRYEAVSGLVEGTFSGTFTGDNGSTVTITEGKFSVIRFYDFSGPDCNGYCM